MMYGEDTYKMEDGYYTFLYWESWAIPTIYHISKKRFSSDDAFHLVDKVMHTDDYEKYIPEGEAYFDRFKDTGRPWDNRRTQIDVDDNGDVYTYSDQYGEYRTFGAGYIDRADDWETSGKYVWKLPNYQNYRHIQQQGFDDAVKAYCGEEHELRVLKKNGFKFGDTRLLTEDQWQDLKRQMGDGICLAAEQKAKSEEMKEIGKRMKMNSRTVDAMMHYLSTKVYEYIEKNVKE